MKRVGDLLKDLGFNSQAPLGTQKAFLRHLIREAEVASKNMSENVVAIESAPKAAPIKSEESVQLSFDPEILKAR